MGEFFACGGAREGQERCDWEMVLIWMIGHSITSTTRIRISMLQFLYLAYMVIMMTQQEYAILSPF